MKRLDYAGIAIATSGATTASFYYGFYCQPYIRDSYIYFSYSLCSICLIASMFEKFHEAKMRRWKVSIYVFLTAFEIIPLMHLIK